MPALYITLKKAEAEFEDFLWGRSSQKLTKNQRALPIKTYNLGTPEESVTFELKNVSDIKKPGIFVFLSSLVKLNSFILILLPLFYIFTKNYSTGLISNPQSNTLSITLAALAVIFLFAGLNIRNDVNDHISGFDRVNLDSKPKPIRMGWISAHKAARVSLILIFIASILAGPVVFFHPELIRVVVVLLVLFFIGRFAKKNSYKQQHLGELILFILVGPVLASGYQMALGAAIDIEVLSFGVLWGFAVSYLIQVNNFSHIMTSSQSGISNSMTKLGFDRAQKFLVWSWSMFLLTWIFFHYLYAEVFAAIIVTVLLILWSIPFLKKILNIKSPMGSGLQQIHREAQKTFLFMVSILVLENLTSLWTN